MAEEIIALTTRLLQKIDEGDWNAYCEMMAEDVTCFEPEAKGALVQGLPFHKFYFDLAAKAKPKAGSVTSRNTISSPNVRFLGDSVAIISYVRLTQRVTGHDAQTVRTDETRIWERRSNGWKVVHFHRSY
jgi:calcium/calmodulin-dependent protein kinase (CaM kinase) II